MSTVNSTRVCDTRVESTSAGGRGPNLRVGRCAPPGRKRRPAGTSRETTLAGKARHGGKASVPVLRATGGVSAHTAPSDRDQACRIGPNFRPTPIGDKGGPKGLGEEGLGNSPVHPCRGADEGGALQLGATPKRSSEGSEQAQNTTQPCCVRHTRRSMIEKWPLSHELKPKWQRNQVTRAKARDSCVAARVDLCELVLRTCASCVAHPSTQTPGAVQPFVPLLGRCAQEAGGRRRA